MATEPICEVRPVSSLHWHWLLLLRWTDNLGRYVIYLSAMLFWLLLLSLSSGVADRVLIWPGNLEMSVLGQELAVELRPLGIKIAIDNEVIDLRP